MRRCKAINEVKKAISGGGRCGLLTPHAPTTITDNPTMLKFELLTTDAAQGDHPGTHARRGRLTLNHGVVETPIFMPVGTYGTVKGVMPRSLHDMGAQIILGNTFHLWMRPGLDVMQSFGGLHPFEKVGQAHPDRLRRLPGLEPGRNAQDQRGRRALLQRRSTATSCSSRPRSAMQIQTIAELRHRDAVR
jgi:hypothetical protein